MKRELTIGEAFKLLDLHRTAKLAKPSPVPCKGYVTHTPDASEYDCDYATGIACDDCIVNGGKLDPRTGKAYRKRKAKR